MTVQARCEFMYVYRNCGLRIAGTVAISQPVSQLPCEKGDTARVDVQMVFIDRLACVDVWIWRG
jgi:hypothetical protein